MSTKYILSVGRITPEKGFDLLISAYNRLDTDVKLVLAGAPDQDSKYLEELKSIAGSNPNVVFSGFTDGDNLSQLYTNALAYVLSSRIEGFPLVLLEAINFNLPLLVSDIEATHLLKLSTKSYFKANDANAVRDKLSEFLSSEDKGEYKCSEEDLADYCWGKIAEQTIAVYKKQCGNDGDDRQGKAISEISGNICGREYRVEVDHVPDDSVVHVFRRDVGVRLLRPVSYGGYVAYEFCFVATPRRGVPLFD